MKHLKENSDLAAADTKNGYTTQEMIARLSARSPEFAQIMADIKDMTEAEKTAYFAAMGLEY